MQITRNQIAIVLAAAFVCIVVLWLFIKSNGPKAYDFYTAETPSYRPLAQYVNAAGKLQAEDEITVGSLEAGRVVEILADDNDIVKKGQLLLRLDNGINYSAVKKLKALVDRAKARLIYQEKFWKRQKQLFQTHQISTDHFEKVTRDLEIAQANLKANEGELEIQKQQYDNIFIRAPEDGIIIARKVDLGQMITARLQATELFIIAKDLKKMEVRVDVDEADVGMVKEKQEAIFTVDAFQRKKFKGMVTQVQYLARIIENVVTYAAIVEVANPDLMLRPGMTANIDIKVAKAPNALSIPNKALRINSLALEEIAKKFGYTFERIPETTAKTDIDNVWVVDDKQFKQVKVTLGVTDGKYTQIVDGINKSTTILAEIEEPQPENRLLKMIFSPKSGIGAG